MENYFNTLFVINVNDKTEKKGNLTYLSWAYAWGEVKKLFPQANYTIYERKKKIVKHLTDGTIIEEEQVLNYFDDGRTAWVKTGVTIEGIEHIEELPVMDFKNKSMPVELITSFDVNKTIQRSLTKAVARHGLGLYIYAGEDLPSEGSDTPKISKEMEDGLRELIKAKAITNTQVIEVLNKYGFKKLGDITADQVVSVRNELARF